MNLIGRKAKFFFVMGDPLIGTIRSYPGGPGDFFHIEDSEGNDWGIQTFERFIVYPPEIREGDSRG